LKTFFILYAFFWGLANVLWKIWQNISKVSPASGENHVLKFKKKDKGGTSGPPHSKTKRKSLLFIGLGQ
jgi:hypothetical protein